MRALLIPSMLLGLAGCATPPTNPADVRPPDARLVAAPARLTDIPAGVMADARMWEAYGQCRVIYADEADRRLGLIAYTNAVRRK